MPQETNKPSWVAIAGLIVALAGGGLSLYQWLNSETNLTINAAIELSTKDLHDSGIEKIRNDYLDWFHNKVTDENRDRKIFAAQRLVLYLDYVAQLLNSKRVHEGYVSLLLKCSLINNYSNLYINREPNKDLPSRDKIVNLVEFYQRHQNMDCRLVSRS